MRYTNCRFFQLVLIVILLLPLPAFAIPAITCHCFTDRSYDMVHPAAADPYFLATTQNSFFAIVFNADKKGIVFKKQQGVSSEDIWVAYWVASRSNVSSESLLQARQKKEVWQDVLAPLHLTAKTLGVQLSAALNARSSSAQLAEKVVDEIFNRYHLLDHVELNSMRRERASNQELIIATVIAAKSRRSAKQVYLEVKNGVKTWGTLLQDANIDTKNMQQEISSILKLHPLK